MRLLLFSVFWLYSLIGFGQVADSTLRKTESLSSPDQRMRLLIKEGMLVNQTDAVQSMAYFSEAAKDTVSVSDPFLLDSLFRLKAFVYGNLNNRPKTLKAHLRRVEILTALDSSTKALASAYYETAHIFKSLGNDSLALPYFLNCLEVAEEVGHITQKGQVLIDIGDMNYEQGKMEQAIENYDGAIEIFIEIDRLRFIVGVAKVKQARVYSDMGNRRLAFKNVEEAVKLPDTSDYTFLDYAGETFMGAGQVYLDNGLNERAIVELRKAQGLYERHGKYFYLPDAYKLLAEAYRPVNIDSAFLFLDWYVILNDSVINEQNNELITQLRFEFEEEQREQEIKFLEEEKEIVEQNNELIQAESDRKSELINTIIVALVVVIGLLVFVIYGFRLIRKKNKLVQKQKRLVEERNKEIEDSITYAERIQRAVVPEEQRMQAVLNNAFVYYNPKDVLSGDFYWVYNVHTNEGIDLKLFAVGDCTGHGIPGALLSVLGINYLNLGAVSNEINSTGEALDFLNQGIVQTFGHSTEMIRDGMDIVLGAINPDTLELYYSCAKNPIYLIRKKEVIVLKGEKKAIGNDEYDAGFKFSTSTFQLEKNDVIFAISDGFQDQFGGEKGKKFKISQMKELFVEIAEKPMSEQQLLVEKAFRDWLGTQEQIDDVTVMGIRI